MTSLVGAGIARQIAGKAGVPFCVMNSDFYIGPDPPRSLEEDFDERSRPEVEYLAEQMQHADLVLHAVDQIFDYGFRPVAAAQSLRGAFALGKARTRSRVSGRTGQTLGFSSPSALRSNRTR